MLSALMDGRALTAKELAFAGGVTPQTASEHLHKLVRDRILKSTAQGRFRYFRLASQPVSQMLESMMVLAASKRRPRFPERGHKGSRLNISHCACPGNQAHVLTSNLSAKDWVDPRGINESVTDERSLSHAELFCLDEAVAWGR